MSTDLPSFWFPPRGPALPPLPESTIEPMPPIDDPRLAGTYESLDALQWYMYSALQNNDSYLAGYFSWEESQIYMGDVIVPESRPPEKDLSAEGDEWVLGWEMWCLRCPSPVDSNNPERNAVTGYPFCGETMLSMEPLITFSGQRIEPDLEVPIWTESGADSVMACAIEQKLDPDWLQKIGFAIEYPRVMSNIFIVTRALRAPESEYPGIRYRYNSTYPWGVPDDQVQATQPSSTPEPSPTPTYTTTSDWWDWPYTYSPTRTSRPVPYTPSDKEIKDDKTTGIVIGVIVPILVIITVIICLGTRKRYQQRTPTNFNPAADARRQEALADRTRRSTAAATSTTTVQDDPDDMPPPAYHKVVTELERRDIEQRMHANGTANLGWAPTYTDAQHTGTTGISQPPPVARVPGQENQVTYPSLPSSPPR
jgi:hypothetical protein